MSARRKSVYSISAAVIFILMELAAAVTLSRSSSLQNIWINRMSHRVLAAVWGWGDGIRDYLSLRSTNDRLALENFELSRQLDYFHNLYPEEIDNAVKDKPRDQFCYVPAKIIKISRNSQHNYIIINKGSEDGITPHSGIISRDGVVGIIDAVDKHFAYGLTLMNPKVSVSARLGKNGPVASLSWDGIHSNIALLKGIPLHFESSPGDTVFTSGISSLFPGDIPVGIVRNIRLVDGISGEMPVELFQDFSALRYVTVAYDPYRGEIEDLEKKEEDI